MSDQQTGKTFVTDFDGTLCRNEFYQLVRDRLLGPETPNFWEDFTSGRVSHVAVLQAYFSAIRATEDEVLALLPLMEIEPRFAELAGALEKRGWSLVIASAGCGWYIEQLLRPQKVRYTLHTNPGRWVGGDRGLLMEPPTSSPFYCPEHGIDKRAIVQHAIQRSAMVAFAGDGLTDVAAAGLVPRHLRFARGDCARELKDQQLAFRDFDRWAEVAEALLELG
jgi:2-hydroxy-3-keto-5-methylthiopentenyl-1-phosphate phosphatase